LEFAPWGRTSYYFAPKCGAGLVCTDGLCRDVSHHPRTLNFRFLARYRAFGFAWAAAKIAGNVCDLNCGGVRIQPVISYSAMWYVWSAFRKRSMMKFSNAHSKGRLRKPITCQLLNGRLSRTYAPLTESYSLDPFAEGPTTMSLQRFGGSSPNMAENRRTVA